MLAQRGVARRKLWCYLFAVVFLAGAAWSMVTPVLGATDELQHGVRAAAAARGELLGRPFRSVYGWWSSVHVPEAYRRLHFTGICYQGNPDVTPDCQQFTGGRTERETFTYEFHAPPPYYFVVGLPTLRFPAATGVYLMRLVSVALGAALLASAFVAALELANKLVVLAVLLATTPVVLYLVASVNPNGFEIAAAVCAWTALVALARTDVVESHHISRAGIGLTCLGAARGLSPGFVVIALGTMALLTPRARLRSLLEARRARVWLVVIALSAITTATWALWTEIAYPIPHSGLGLGTALRRAPGILPQMVASFGVGDVVPPLAAAIVWLVIAGALILVGLATARRVERRVLGALIVVALVLPLSSDALDVPRIGTIWYGRYSLPLWAGILVVVAAVARPARISSAAAQALPTIVTAASLALVGVHTYVFYWVAHRFAVGVHGPALHLLFSARWRPPLRWHPVIAAFFVGVTGMTALAVTPTWIYSRARRTARPSPAS